MGGGEQSGHFKGKREGENVCVLIFQLREMKKKTKLA